MQLIGPKTPIVSMQFSVSNKDIVPKTLVDAGAESFEEWSERKGMPNGKLVIKPTELTSIAEFPVDLEGNGYEMVIAFYKERIHSSSFASKTYHMVRFVFCRSEIAVVSDAFCNARDEIRRDLGVICTRSLWRTRVFENPYFRGGKIVPDLHAVSINLEARQPLYNPDGQPIKVWKKDESGQRVGDGPETLSPHHRLQIVGSKITLS